MYVVFIHGPPASGKYTIATELSRLTGLSLFHNHLTVDLVSSLFEFGSDAFIRLRERIWLAAFEEAASENRPFIFTFAPESTVSPDFIDRAEAAINRARGHIYFVECRCPDEVIEARIENASRLAFGKLSSIDKYRELKAAGAFDFHQLPPPLLSVATDGISAQDAARSIGDRLASIGT